jgi:hypothetical protein
VRGVVVEGEGAESSVRAVVVAQLQAVRVRGVVVRGESRCS